jgi:hypothetical protein
MLAHQKSGFDATGVIFCAFFTIAAMACAGAYSGGSGTAADPYKISVKADLLALAATTGDYGKCFILTADIDLAGETFTTAVIAPDTDSTPYSGFQGTAFTGFFDGDSHILYNLTIFTTTTDCLGLFGSVGSGGQIRNLGIENANIYGVQYVSGLVGINDGTITACYITGIVGGGCFVGDLVGYNSSGTITAC